MQQQAPYSTELADLVQAVRYKPDWQFWLNATLDRGQGSQGISQGMTLVIQITTPDAYHPEELRRVNHFFPVPPAAYDYRSWRRWVFEQILLVERHEAMEYFQLEVGGEVGISNQVDGEHPATVRPYAPSHGEGNDPYLIREIGTDVDQRTSFRNKVYESSS